MSVEPTQLLNEIRAGDKRAFDQLAAQLYQELRRLSGKMRIGQRQDATLDTTALVHEAYLRMSGAGSIAINDRKHLFALAGRVMRQVLIDHARERLADKRGGGAVPTTLSDKDLAVLDEAEQMVALDQALQSLAAHDPRQAQVVECRFFAGLSEEETAEALGVSVRTVQLDWAKARRHLLGGDDAA